MATPGYAQDTLLRGAVNGLIDSPFQDTIPSESPAVVTNPGVVMSPDGLDAKVEYGSVELPIISTIPPAKSISLETPMSAIKTCP